MTRDDDSARETRMAVRNTIELGASLLFPLLLTDGAKPGDTLRFKILRSGERLDVDVVLKRITLRGSIVGNRNDLAEAIEFAAEGKVRAHIHEAKLADINRIFLDMKAGRIDGRVVLTLP